MQVDVTNNKKLIESNLFWSALHEDLQKDHPQKIHIEYCSIDQKVNLGCQSTF